MPLPDRLELPPTADFHVHLRDGEMMELITPTVKQGGCDTAYIMVCRTISLPFPLIGIPPPEQHPHTPSCTANISIA